MDWSDIDGSTKTTKARNDDPWCWRKDFGLEASHIQSNASVNVQFYKQQHKSLNKENLIMCSSLMLYLLMKNPFHII